jgi:hypothetical protein
MPAISPSSLLVAAAAAIAARVSSVKNLGSPIAG